MSRSTSYRRRDLEGAQMRSTRSSPGRSSQGSGRCSGRIRGSLRRGCEMNGSRMKTFDSLAWVEYFRGSSVGKEVREMVEGDEVLFTPAICLTELKVKY